MKLKLQVQCVSIVLCLACFAVGKATRKRVSVDIGPTFIPGTKPFTNLGRIFAKNTKNIPLTGFKSARQGKAFHISLSLAPGTYDVDMGFVETQFCFKSGRVFHIYVNGELRRESVDIFKAAKGCHRAYVDSIPKISISEIQLEPIIVRLVSVSGLATISYLQASPSNKQCVPVTRRAKISALHLAHAIPGTYPSVIDRDEDRYEVVRLDGRESHTHFSYSGGSGKIISYEWALIESGKVISTRPTFKYKFPLGTSRVRLTVTDNICTQHSDVTSITVRTTIIRGQYCYFYRYGDQTKDLQPQTLRKSTHPVSTTVSKNTQVVFPSSDLTEGFFVARCIFFLSFGRPSKPSTLAVTTHGTGLARVYKGRDLILDSRMLSTTEDENVPEGMQSLEVIYTRTNLKKSPFLSIKVNGYRSSNVYHDRSSVIPIITKIDPKSGSLSGGTMVRLYGSGFQYPMKVRFGWKTKTVVSREAGNTEWSASVAAPSAKIPGRILLKIESAFGTRSNAVYYEYGNRCDDVSFEPAKLVTKYKKDLELNQPTSVALGNDNRIYMGMRVGYIQVLAYDSISLKVSDICFSESYRDPNYKTGKGNPARREILGITFDPRDKVPRPYVSMSTLFWSNKKLIDPKNKRAWSNGAIERFKPATPSTRFKRALQCLEHDRNIVRNLPVSDADHGVNELIFNQNGDLLIAVGGNTNMGLPSYKFGGLWETYFSSSVVIARLSRGPRFNGDIVYTTPENPQTARPKPGYTDVELYATGFRNLFSLAMARNGRIYGIDMGPNNLFGNASTACDQYNKQTKKGRVNSVPGRIMIDLFREGERKYGPGRGDKLVEVKEGKFYGHANIQRALMTKTLGECSWVDPVTGKRPGGAPAPRNYEHHLSYFSSAKTGLQEYGSSHFCGKMRGNLVMSKNSGLGTLRLIMNKCNCGKVSGAPREFIPRSGIRVMENIRGDLLFPQYQGKSGVLVHRPKVNTKATLTITNALPFRHGRHGGTPLTIGGLGFRNGAKVLVGTKNCPVKRLTPSEIECTVPAMKRGSLVSVTVIIRDLKRTLEQAILYMKV